MTCPMAEKTTSPAGHQIRLQSPACDDGAGQPEHGSLEEAGLLPLAWQRRFLPCPHDFSLGR